MRDRIIVHGNNPTTYNLSWLLIIHNISILQYEQDIEPYSRQNNPQLINLQSQSPTSQVNMVAKEIYVAVIGINL